MKHTPKTALVLALVLWAIIDGPSATAFQITLFPATAVYDPDPKLLHERLGVDGQDLYVEDFENKELKSWLHTDLQGGGGEESEIAPWAGLLTSAYANSARLEFTLPGIRQIGIGLNDNDGGGERLSINGQAPIELKKLPGHASDGRSRAYYVMVEAGTDDPAISRIDFDRCFTVRFDHLVVLQNRIPRPPQERPPRLVVDLIDGSRLVGEVLNDSVVAAVVNGGRELHLADIYSMRLADATGAVTILLRVGQRVAGETRFSEIKVRTALGELSIPRAMIRQIKTSPRGQYQPNRKNPLGKVCGLNCSETAPTQGRGGPGATRPVLGGGSPSVGSPVPRSRERGPDWTVFHREADPSAGRHWLGSKGSRPGSAESCLHTGTPRVCSSGHREDPDRGQRMNASPSTRGR